MKLHSVIAPVTVLALLLPAMAARAQRDECLQVRADVSLIGHLDWAQVTLTVENACAVSLQATEQAAVLIDGQVVSMVDLAQGVGYAFVFIRAAASHEVCVEARLFDAALARERGIEQGFVTARACTSTQALVPAPPPPPPRRGRIR